MKITKAFEYIKTVKSVFKFIGATISLLLMGNLTQAQVVVDLNLAAAGSHTNAVVLTSQTLGAATFDIAYTIGAAATGANPFVQSTGTSMGVGSDDDIASHYTSMEGNDNEIMSFTGLTVTNFVANGSGYTAADITGLTFTGLRFGAVSNANDGVNVSFDNFTTQDNQNLNATANDALVSVTGFTNYSAPETNMYITNDGNQSNNRFSVNGIQVTYMVPIPEPSTFTLLIGALGSLVLIRRRRG